MRSQINQTAYVPLFPKVIQQPKYVLSDRFQLWPFEVFWVGQRKIIKIIIHLEHILRRRENIAFLSNFLGKNIHFNRSTDAPTCVLVSSVPLPPEWRHTAVGTSGSPPFCGRWRQHGTVQWTCPPLGTRMAPSTHTRTVWHCCWMSCSHTVTGDKDIHTDTEKRTQRLWVHVMIQILSCWRQKERCIVRAAPAALFYMCQLFLIPFSHFYFPSLHLFNMVTVCRQEQTKALIYSAIKESKCFWPS